MEQLKNPSVVMFHPIRYGLHVRFSMDGVMGDLFGNAEDGLKIVEQYEKDGIVPPLQAKGMAMAVKTHAFLDVSSFPEEQWPKPFIILSNGDWHSPPGEGESSDLSPLPATDDKAWILLEGVQTVH